MKVTIADIQIASNPEEVEKITSWLTSALSKTGMSSMNQYQFMCAVVEAVNNCIQHAYDFRRDQIICLSGNIDKTDVVTITIKDKGRAFRPDLSQHSSDLLAEHGRGLNIISSWTSKVSYERNGSWNIARLHKDIL